MSCLEVRPRLTELALGVLPEAEAREVERHLEWCPGCRREAAELEEGAVAMAMALPPVSPPPDLEGRVVQRLRAATGRVRPHQRRIRVLLAAALTAALLALGATGWALAERSHAQTLEQRLASARGRVESLAQVLRGTGGGRTFEAVLLPPDGRTGSGYAVVFSAPRVDDLLFVDVVLPERARGPFVVQVVASGQAWDAGRLQKTVSGEWVLSRRTGLDLSGAVAVTVLDANSHLVVTGQTRPYAGS
jgi:hypothetical protein